MTARYERYKPSGIEWLGDIPQHWEIIKLKYAVDVNPNKKTYEFNKDSEVEVVFLPMEKVSENGKISQDSRRKINEVSTGYTYFEKKDIILAKITPCFENGKASYLENLNTNFGFGSTEFHVLRSKDINNKFLYYQISSDIFRKRGEASMTGSAGQKRVPASFIQEYRIAVPPPKEQIRIGEYLDAQKSEINKLIANQEKLIELLKEEKSAIIHKTVYGAEKSRERKKLKYLAKLKSGESITSDSIRPDGEYPVYGGNGLRGYTSTYTHEGNYVLIGRQGALCGNINYASGKFFASEHAIVVSILDDSDYFWLGELLRSMNLNQYSIASAQPGLSVERIQNLIIEYPSVNEQKKIVEYIKNESSRIDNLIFKIRTQIQLAEEYRAALIIEVITGKQKVI